MMSTVEVTQIDNCDMLIHCAPNIATELHQHFSYRVEGYRYIPAYQSGAWDGFIRIFKIGERKLPVGLYQRLIEFCDQHGYEVVVKRHENVPAPIDRIDMTRDQLMEFVKTLNLHAGGEPIIPYDYQIDGVLEGIRSRRKVLISPTGSGKSLVFYILVRWCMEYLAAGKLLVIVPTTSLVKQLYSDFNDYSSDDPYFDVNEDVHQIMGGTDKNAEQRIYISTWQSIYKQPQAYFRQFHAIFGDECHGFAAKSLSSIMNKSRNAELRFGATGTLNGSKCHQMVLEGLFGTTFNVTTTKKLQDAKTLAQLEIKMCEFRHPDHTRAGISDLTYQQEVSNIIQCDARNNAIANLASNCDGNTLVLFQFVEKQGRPLRDLIRDLVGDTRKVYYVAGSVKASDREKIRNIVENQRNAIIVASMGTFSTGINIKELHNLIFASPSKSQIRVLQSIGRILRLSKDRSVMTLYDLSDDYKYKGRENYAMKHARDRLKIYKEQQFNTTQHSIPLEYGE